MNDTSIYGYPLSDGRIAILNNGTVKIQHIDESTGVILAAIPKGHGFTLAIISAEEFEQLKAVRNE